MLTYADLLDHVLAYAGTDATASSSARHRMAVQAAVECLPNKHQWQYLWGVLRIATVAPQTTGTVEYDHTGGAFERQLTLSGATWPTWAASGTVVIADVPYTVEARKSAAVLTLGEATNPGADVAALTAYEIRRDLYDLPADFVAADEAVLNSIGTVLAYTHPRDWSSQRRVNVGPGQPQSFSLIGANNSPGRMRVALWPAPDGVYSIDMLYRRKPRTLVYADVSAGTVSGSAAGTTLTGTQTAFLAAHVGSVVRLAGDNTAAPSGPRGDNPAVYEGVVTAYTSASSIEVAPALTVAADAVRYVLTDPVDIAAETMAEYLLRECEKQYRAVARMKPAGNEDTNYALAFQQALEADGRYTGRVAAMRQQSRRSGFSHYPIDFGV